MALIFKHSPAQQNSNDTSPVLIMLHGRGADENDLFGLSNYFDERLTIYSLRAPYEFGWGGYAWFDLYEDGTVDEESFLHSRNEILGFINTLQSQKLFLLGFSMGAIMSYSIALANPGLCKGILCLSGFAPRQIDHEYKLNELQNLHIFISHGINDPVIPISSARKTKELLDSSNAHITYNEYQMAHQISEECLMDIKAWIADVI